MNKLKLLSSLNITLEMIDNNTFRIIKIETEEKSKFLSERQLNFKKDDTKNLVRKFNDVRYKDYRKEIFDILNKRYSDTLFRPTCRNKKNLELLKPMFDKIFDDLIKSIEIKKVA
jgi:hypothetical protein